MTSWSLTSSYLAFFFPFWMYPRTHPYSCFAMFPSHSQLKIDDDAIHSSMSDSWQKYAPALTIFSNFVWISSVVLCLGRCRFWWCLVTVVFWWPHFHLLLTILSITAFSNEFEHTAWLKQVRWNFVILSSSNLSIRQFCMLKYFLFCHLCCPRNVQEPSPTPQNSNNLQFSFCLFFSWSNFTTVGSCGKHDCVN